MAQDASRLKPLLLPTTAAARAPARGGDGDGGPGDMALYVI